MKTHFMFSLPKSLIPPPSLTDVVIPEDSRTQTEVGNVTTPTNPPTADVPPALLEKEFQEKCV